MTQDVIKRAKGEKKAKPLMGTFEVVGEDAYYVSMILHVGQADEFLRRNGREGAVVSAIDEIRRMQAERRDAVANEDPRDRLLHGRARGLSLTAGGKLRFTSGFYVASDDGDLVEIVPKWETPFHHLRGFIDAGAKVRIEE